MSEVVYVNPHNLHLQRAPTRCQAPFSQRASVRNARSLIVDTGGQEAVKCAADALSGTGYTLTCLPVRCDATICPDTISWSSEDTLRSLTPKRVLPPKKRSNYARHRVLLLFTVLSEWCACWRFYARRAWQRHNMHALAAMTACLHANLLIERYRTRPRRALTVKVWTLCARSYERQEHSLNKQCFKYFFLNFRVIRVKHIVL